MKYLLLGTFLGFNTGLYIRNRGLLDVIGEAGVRKGYELRNQIEKQIEEQGIMGSIHTNTEENKQEHENEVKGSEPTG